MHLQFFLSVIFTNENSCCDILLASLDDKDFSKSGYSHKETNLLPGFKSRLFSFRVTQLTRPRGYKTFFMLNSLEHEILNAHKYENINKVSIFQAQISLECYFSCS